MPATEALRDGEHADLPGRPLVRHTPGNTAGRCGLEFPEQDAR
jgi:hypothetical protein